jgi:hypothetical protein
MLRCSGSYGMVPRSCPKIDTTLVVVYRYIDLAYWQFQWQVGCYYCMGISAQSGSVRHVGLHIQAVSGSSSLLLSSAASLAMLILLIPSLMFSTPPSSELLSLSSRIASVSCTESVASKGWNWATCDRRVLCQGAIEQVERADGGQIERKCR